MFFVNEMEVARRRAFEALDGGVVVCDGPANHFRRWEAAGGWLALSDVWLTFIPHRYNGQVGRLLIPTASIRRAMPRRTGILGLLPVLPNLLVVETTSGRVYRFVVANRRAWVAAFRYLDAANEDGPRDREQEPWKWPEAEEP